MKIHAINLPRCQDRRENILRECARFDLEVEIFPGVDGRELTKEQLREATYLPDENPITPGEIGCALSHRGIYEKMLRENTPAALVLEDDSVFGEDPRPLLSALESLDADLPEVFLLTQRHNQHMRDMFSMVKSGFRFRRCLNGFGGNGYVLTRSAARNLQKFQTPLRVTADDWKLFLLSGAVTLYCHERESVGLRPELATASLLEPERSRSDPSRRRRKYLWKIRRSAPLWPRVKHALAKIAADPVLNPGRA